MLLGPIADLQADAAEAYDNYRDAETPAELAHWREESEELVPAARAWRIAQWSTIAVGAGAATYAVVARIRSERAPEQLRDRLITEELAVEAAVAERIRDGERGTLVVRGYPPDAVPQFTIGDRIASNMALVPANDPPGTVSVGVAGAGEDSLELDPAAMPAVVVLGR